MANASLDTGKEYIHEMFSSNNFYNIPEYQRSFVWGADNVLTMIEDVASAMTQVPRREYFLGCMIWNSKSDTKGGISYEYKDILDGQQRFITLYLLQGVIRDLSNSIDLKQNVANTLKQQKNQYKSIPERNRLEFSIRKDGDFLNAFVVTPGGTGLRSEMDVFVEAQNVHGTSVKKMAEAINEMHNWWALKKQGFASEAFFQQYLDEFYSYLSTQVLVLYLSTSNNLDDAYNLFTVLNSRGIQLQSSDILRAQNLRDIKDDAKKNLFASQWDEYQAATEGIYRTFDEFLWAMVYVVMKYTSDANKNLSKAFDFMHKRGDLKKGSETFEFIGKYIKHLEAITTSNYQSKEAGSLYENLNYILTTTFGNQYLMVLMHYRQNFGDVNILDFLVKIDNIFSASWLTDNRNLQTRSFIIMRKMDEVSKRIGDKELASNEFLLDKVLTYSYEDDKASTIIDVDKFFTLLNTEEWGSFSGTRINKTRYLLLKLDLLTGSDAIKLQFNKSVASVEHLMPQKIDAKSWTVEPEIHKKWLHKLGNIVLVDKRKNSSLSNASYEVKKQKFSDQYIETRANTTYVFSKNTDWTEVAIQKNHSRAVGLLKAYYQGNSLKTFKEVKKKLF